MQMMVHPVFAKSLSTVMTCVEHMAVLRGVLAGVLLKRAIRFGVHHLCRLPIILYRALESEPTKKRVLVVCGIRRP